MGLGRAARCLCLALLAVATGAHDIDQLLAELKFEPHHRNFVRNLYEKQMLGFVGDKDLATIGMDAPTRQRFHGLKAHLLNGAEKPTAPAGVVGNHQIFAADGTTVLKPGEENSETPQAVNARRKLASRSASTAVRNHEAQEQQAQAAQAAAEGDASAEIARLEKLKTEAAMDERYSEAAELKAQIQQLKDAQDARQAAAQAPPPPPPPSARSQMPPPPPMAAMQASTGGLGRHLEESIGSGLGMGIGMGGAGSPPPPPASPEEAEYRRLKRTKVEEMVTTLGISKRYVGFVSNLVEKGTFENVKDAELKQLGLSDDELAGFGVIKDWARIRDADGGVGSEAEASTMRRQLRDAKERKTRDEQRERAKREAQAAQEEQEQQQQQASTQQTREASAAGSGARPAAASINAAGEAAAAGVTAEGRTEHNALCPMLPAITNGQVDYSNERVAPCSATFTCDEGYSLGGHGVTETVIDCVPAGRSAFWSGAPPTCTAIAGSAPGDVDEPR